MVVLSLTLVLCTLHLNQMLKLLPPKPILNLLRMIQVDTPLLILLPKRYLLIKRYHLLSVLKLILSFSVLEELLLVNVVILFLLVE